MTQQEKRHAALVKAALAYAAIGWHILPAWWIREDRSCACGNPECTSPGKHPIGKLVKTGQHSSTTDANVIAQWWNQYPDANIAAYLGPSKLCAIDIDPRNGGYDTMEMLEAKHGKLDSDLLQFSGGGGEHRIFQLPESAGLSLPGTLGKGVDVKINGYIMLEPSNHLSGHLYGWEVSSDPRDGAVPSPLPDWIRDLSRSPFNAMPFIPATRMVDEKQVEELRAALSLLSADDYHQWVNFGNALSELGQAGFSLWDEWSSKSAKYTPAGATAKWRNLRPGSFQLESIFFAAQQAGWLNPAKVESVISVAPPVQVFEASAEMAQWAEEDEATPEREITPIELLSLPGVMGDCMNWMTRTANRPQPVLSMVATLSLFATALSTKIATPTRLRTNLYFVGVAGTSAGKDHGRKCLAKVLQAARLDSLIGGDEIGSGQGLLSRAHKCPRTVFQIDEFGLMLQSIRSKNAGAHLSSIIKNLMILFGATDSVYRGTEYADQVNRARKDIEYPCVNLHATTTPEQFFPALGSQDVTSGALNRMYVIFAPDGVVRMQDAEHEDPPEGVVKWIEAVQLLQNGMQGLTPANPLIAGYGPGAKALMTEFSNWIDDMGSESTDPQIRQLWGRAWENTAKLALIHSMASIVDPAVLDQRARNNALQITSVSAQWAIEFTKYFLGEMQRELDERMGDSEFDILVKEVIRVIRAGGRKGRTQRELGNFCKPYKAKEPRMQDAVLVAIARREEAVQMAFPSASGRGKARTAWVASEYLEEAQTISVDANPPLYMGTTCTTH